MGLEDNKVELNQVVISSVVVEPSNTTFKEVYYSVDDNNILNIDEDNNIIAVGYGTATITVTNSNNIVQELEITVPNIPLITTIIIMSGLGTLVIIILVVKSKKKKVKQ